MEKMIIGIDLGGTAMKCGLLNGKGEILKRLTVPTPVGSGEHGIVKAMGRAVRELLKQEGLDERAIQGIGLGVPGYLNRETGAVTKAPNLGWAHYPAKRLLEEEARLPVVMDNDANLALSGEMWKGAGRGARHLIMVTLGTGVGGGIAINGEVVGGPSGTGGEIGHITVNPEGLVCGCGKRGCLETEASAAAIVRKVHQALEKGRDSLLRPLWEGRGAVTAKVVADAAREGDPLARQAVGEAAWYLAFALGALVNALNPEKILLGGGLSAAGAVLLEPFRDYLNRFALPEALAALSVEQAALGNDAGLIGAAYAVLSGTVA